MSDDTIRVKIGAFNYVFSNTPVDLAIQKVLTQIEDNNKEEDDNES